jgi:twitching motility protein PilT
VNFDQFLRFCVEQKASDVHLQAGAMPMLRIGRHLRGVEGQAVGGQELSAFVAAIEPRREAGSQRPAGGLFIHEVPGLARFRCQPGTHLGEPCLTLRVIPAAVPAFEETNLPAAVRDVAQARRGLVFVGGEAGSGRTTTLATLVDQINASSVCKVVTVDSPVEFRHPNKKALVTQHEVGTDVPTVAEGLARAMQEDPDVVAVGELSDPAAIRLALALAEGGRQVLAVCTGPTAVGTIDRIVGKLPPEEQRGAMRQVALALEAVIVLRLATTRDGGRRPAVEVLRGGPYTMRALLENRPQDLATQLTGRQGGMQSFDQHLVELYQAGVLSGTEAMRLSTSPEAVAGGLRAAPPKREAVAG